MNISSFAITATILLSTLSGSAFAEKKDAGQGHDYRTFHSKGEIKYGNIADSYTADLAK